METLHRVLQSGFYKSDPPRFTKSSLREESLAEMAPCHQEGFGHYQCNSALRLAKILKKNPRPVAQEIEASAGFRRRARCAKRSRSPGRDF